MRATHPKHYFQQAFRRGRYYHPCCSTSILQIFLPIPWLDFYFTLMIPLSMGTRSMPRRLPRRYGIIWTDLLDYYDKWKITINTDKTETINFNRKFINNKILTKLKIKDKTIEERNAVKYLGVTVDKKLCFASSYNTENKQDVRDP